MAVIDPSWTPVDGQVGLYLESYTRMNLITGKPMLCRFLHSADGYCFYYLQDKYYDEEGNEIPENEVTPEMRIYYQYMSITESTDIADFISVPVDPAYEIVNKPIDMEIM